MNVEKPQNLYHYSSIQSLALILKHKKIRFNRLDCVDDLTEAETLEGKQLGQHYFVSCWTDSQAENIPLWKMYTEFKGIRVKLPSDMYKSYEINGKEGEKHRIDNHGLFIDLRLPYKGPIDPHNLLTPDYVIMPAFYGSDFLIQIQYTGNKNLLCPRVLYKEPTETTILLGDFCKYKSLEWAFQQEWRFVIHMTPVDKKALLNGSRRIEELLPTITRHHQFPLQEYYLELREDIFDNLVIMLGPKCSEGDYEIVRTLAEKHAPRATLEQSFFTGKL